eukprot:gene15327-biopygen2153
MPSICTIPWPRETYQICGKLGETSGSCGDAVYGENAVKLRRNYGEIIQRCGEATVKLRQSYDKPTITPVGTIACGTSPVNSVRRPAARHRRARRPARGRRGRCPPSARRRGAQRCTGCTHRDWDRIHSYFAAPPGCPRNRALTGGSAPGQKFGPRFAWSPCGVFGPGSGISSLVGGGQRETAVPASGPHLFLCILLFGPRPVCVRPASVSLQLFGPRSVRVRFRFSQVDQGGAAATDAGAEGRPAGVCWRVPQRFLAWLWLRHAVHSQSPGVLRPERRRGTSGHPEVPGARFRWRWPVSGHGGQGMVKHVFGNVRIGSSQRRTGRCPARHDRRLASGDEPRLPVIPGILGRVPRRRRLKAPGAGMSSASRLGGGGGGVWVVYMAFCWCGSHKMGKCGVCIPGGTVIVWLEKDRCGVYMCLVAFCDLFGSQGVGMCRLCSTLVVIWLWGSKGSDVCGLCSIMVAVCLLGSTGSEICGVRNFWWAFIPGLKGVEGLPLVRLECSWDLLWDIYNHACFSPGNSFTPPGGISLRPCPCLWSPARVYVFCCTPRHFVLSFVVWVDGVVALDVSSPASFIGSVDRDLVVRIGDSTLISSPRSIAVPPGIGC